jgi:glutamate formiminotransferase / formiminotetrahydrofolate cyclodeaminase
MGLDELKPFNPKEKVIEYLLEDSSSKRLVDMNLTEFANETASESPAPGGGSISANIGALGASLATMVANLSSHKRGWDDKWEFFSNWAEKGQAIKDELLYLVDEDTNAFNKIMEAFGLANSSEADKKIRKQAIEDATKYAIEIPFRVMRKSFEAMEVIEAMVEKGNPNSVTDAGVGALCARSAVVGAFLNVRINGKDLEDKKFLEKIMKEAKDIEAKARKKEDDILKMVDAKIEG